VGSIKFSNGESMFRTLFGSDDSTLDSIPGAPMIDVDFPGGVTSGYVRIVGDLLRMWSALEGGYVDIEIWIWVIELGSDMNSCSEAYLGRGQMGRP
jgi:hypothetical protein